MITGLPLESTNFAVLPPHFTTEGLRILNNLGISNFFDCYEEFPPSFKGCCIYLLASVIYHLPTLRMWWPQADHPVWQSKMFAIFTMETLNDLRNHVVTGKFSDDQLTATGIPNLVRIHKNFDEINEKLKLFEQRLNDQQSQTNIRFEELKDILQGLPEDVVDSLTQHFTVNEQQVSQRDILALKQTFAECMQSLEQRIQATAKEQQELYLRANQVSSPTVISSNVDSTQASSQFRLRCYGERFHMVPEGFEFPTCAAQKLWLSWHLGIAAQNILPLKLLRINYRYDVRQEDKILVSKAALVMNSVEKVARKIGILRPDEVVNSENCATVWNGSFQKYLSCLYSNTYINSPYFRCDDIYYTTLYNRQTTPIEGNRNISTFNYNFGKL